MERGSRSNTESPSVFLHAALGVFRQSKHLTAAPNPVKAFRGAEYRRSRAGSRQDISLLLTLNVRLETEQALYRFLTSHLLTLGPLMDTSGGSLFFISRRTV